MIKCLIRGLVWRWGVASKQTLEMMKLNDTDRDNALAFLRQDRHVSRNKGMQIEFKQF